MHTQQVPALGEAGKVDLSNARPLSLVESAQCCDALRYGGGLTDGFRGLIVSRVAVVADFGLAVMRTRRSKTWPHATPSALTYATLAFWQRHRRRLSIVILTGGRLEESRTEEGVVKSLQLKNEILVLNLQFECL